MYGTTMAGHFARAAISILTLASISLAETSPSSLDPISVPASGSWQGDDGQWSTFHVQVGTPGQLLHLLPGSSVQAGNAIWAIAQESCTEENPDLWDCEEQRGDVFSANESSTWSTSQVSNGSYYNLNPVIESMLGLNANASYGLDTVTLGTANGVLPALPNQLVARIASNDFWVGVIGLSPLRLNTTGFDDPVRTLMGTLSDPDDRKIPSTTWAYTAGAFYKDAPIFGSLTLGGYDSMRFDPNNSVSVPFSINPSQDLQINLQSITYNGTTTQSSSYLLTDTITAYVNSMINYIWLPPEVCDVFESAFGLEYDAATEFYLMNDTTHANLLAENPTFTFTLGGANSTETATIVLPYAAFDLNVSYPHVNGSQWYFPIKRAQYISQYTLGRVFWQEAYVIADYDRRNFTVAQALFPSNSTPELVRILPPGASDSSGGGLSGGAIAGIVMAVLAVVVSALVVLWLLRRRKRRRQTAAQEGSRETTEIKHVPAAPAGEIDGQQIHEKSADGMPFDKKDSELNKAHTWDTTEAPPSELSTGQTPQSLHLETNWPRQFSELPAELPPVVEMEAGRREGN
ncbi:hypothetical protein HII31_03393 [Pseudocercospora fuligena]|uniref:Peptidase A1 domain-containing protein n=1 Tax=Pseudocercospora fuligena TaxID=685502 RepID=A0A8H6RQY3_9PEZI|nr:hypothetical protein HII31_03393 [Pseudocercospora fuligena]